jgi:rhomboid family GlyGly-CTERM serine protease
VFEVPKTTHWRLPAIVAALLVLLHLAGGEPLQALRYERAAVLAGEWWRLLTGHLVHGDLAHLGWNLGGVLLVWWLFGDEYTNPQWLLILLVSTAAVDIGFLWLEPEVDWYVGFSGTLHGCLAAGLAASLRRDADWLTLGVTALLAAKLAWEYFAGPLPLTGGSISLPVIHEAHAYGAIGGLLCGLAILRVRPERARPL